MKKKTMFIRAKERAEKKVTAGKHKGFDGLIVTIGLILLVMILIYAFNVTIVPKLQKSIDNTGNEIDVISEWDATVGSSEGNSNNNN